MKEIIGSNIGKMLLVIGGLGLAYMVYKIFDPPGAEVVKVGGKTYTISQEDLNKLYNILVDSIAQSEWARSLASKIVGTGNPEEIDMVARYLAKRFAQKILFT